MITVIKFKLAELLKKKGYNTQSYRALAQDIGIDHVSLWKIMNKKPYNPSMAMLDKLCNFLKCQPGDVLEYRKDGVKKN